MGKMGGFPGMGGGNFNQLLKQAQKMQQDVMKTQEEVSKKEFDASVGGGAVTVVVTGDKIVKSLKIQKDVVDPNDVEMLEDLVMTATNEALRKAEAALNNEMGKFNLPGLM